MTTLLLAVPLLLGAPVFAQHSLERIWQTESALKFPEGLVLEPEGRFLYVANTDGDPLEKDGKGSIGKVGLDGKVIEVDWVTGLDAPNGLGRHEDLLYAADLTQVVVTDLKKAAIVRRIPIPSSRLLHNIAIDSAGTVYVSDMFAGKVFRIVGEEVSVHLENLRGPAGLLLAGSDMYVFTSDGLMKADAGKTLTTISKGMDGRERNRDGERPGIHPDQLGRCRVLRLRGRDQPGVARHEGEPNRRRGQSL